MSPNFTFAVSPKVFHVKESLTPKDLAEKTLAPVLDAYQVDDFTKHEDGKKKHLLQYLYVDGNKTVPFSDAFNKYILEKGINPTKPVMRDHLS